jgi:glycosyltransferase involved in cell wall biosynthesis
MRQDPSVSLIIAVYNRADFLERVFLSLLNQTFHDFEIVVADDGSGPEIKDLISRYANGFRYSVQHVWHDDDGFRKTIIVNKAVTRTAAPYLIFIDGDCVLHHRFLERHFKRRRVKQVLSGRRVMFDRARTESVTLDDIRSRRIERIRYWWKHAGKIDRWHGIYAPFVHGIRNAGRSNYQILGSNFSVHKADFMSINGYDERIVGRGLEDNNLWVRFVNNGVAARTITREALQYHLYHQADAIPHSEAFIEDYRSTTQTRTRHGIVKE